jgi:virginiamycin B lyase
MEFTIPTANSAPVAIVTATDRKLWFIENGTGSLDSVTTDGTFDAPVPDSKTAYLVGMTATPNGDIWFTEGDGNRIGRFSGGALTMYSIPTDHTAPRELVAGSDGNIWFAQNGSHSIGRLETLTGTVTEFPTPTDGSGPYGITASADGDLWFTEAMVSKIGRITVSGVITEFATPTPNSTPVSIVAGPDGNLWFTENMASKIGRFRR